jgi:hypothetical protein
MLIVIVTVLIIIVIIIRNSDMTLVGLITTRSPCKF